MQLKIVGASFIVGVASAPFFHITLPVLLACLLLLVVGLSIRGSRGLWAFILAFSLGVFRVHGAPRGPHLEDYVCINGVRRFTASGRGAPVQLATVRSVGDPVEKTQGLIWVRFRDSAPPVGTAVVGCGFASTNPPVLPGAPNRAWAWRLRGISTELRLVNSAGPYSEPSRVPNDPSGVLRAVSRGQRDRVPQWIWGRLRRTGTSHLLAISGFHVGLVAWLCRGAVARLLHLSVLIWPWGVNESLSWWVGAGTAWAYAVFAGAPLSAQRAAGMLTLAALAHSLGRRIDPLRLLVAVATTLTLLDPGVVASPSAQLSFGAVFGLIELMPLWQNSWLRAALPRAPRTLADAMSISVASTLGTLPAAAWWFQSLAPLSAVANLLAVPTFTFVVIPLAALSEVLPTQMARIVEHLGGSTVVVLMQLLAYTDVEPWHPAVSGTGALLLVLAIFLCRHLPALAVILSVVALDLRERPTQWRATMLNVGQGDATLIEQPDGLRMLVDTGPRSYDLLPYLRRTARTTIDVLALSHSDADHTANAAELIMNLNIKEVWIPEVAGFEEVLAAASLTGTPVIERRSFRGEGDNATMLHLVLGPDHRKLVLLGDLNGEREMELVNSLPANAVLKVAHHGSKSSTSTAFIRQLKPSLAVISTGRNNPYGHPHEQTLHTLERTPTLRTDQEGTLQVNLETGEIFAYRPLSGWLKVRVPTKLSLLSSNQPQP